MMKRTKFCRYTVIVLIGFILGFLLGRYTPFLKEFRAYIVSQEEKAIITTLSQEEKEMIDQLDLYENYDFFRDLEAIRDSVRNLFVTDAWAETASVEEEEEIIEDLDLYEEDAFWGEVSKGDELFVQNITEEEWEMLLDEDLDYYMVIKISKKEGEEDEE